MVSTGPYCLLVTIACCCLCLAGRSEGADGKHAWGYGKRNGPRTWPGTCGTGLYQSPIDLSILSAHPRSFEPLIFFQYDQHANVTVKNNGHTVTLTMQQPCTAHIAGGGLPGPYALAQVHYHWGSEHTVDDKRFPLEAHFVHYDRRQFSSLKDAVGQDGGLAVLGVLYRESTETNAAISHVLNGVLGVTEEGSQMLLPGGLRLQQLLPRDTETFYRYRGSLTTPECNEGVLWTVLTTPATITKEQVAQFKELKTHEENLDSNYRPIQPLNGRDLYVRVEMNAAPAVSSISWVLLTICALIVAA